MNGIPAQDLLLDNAHHDGFTAQKGSCCIDPFSLLSRFY